MPSPIKVLHLITWLAPGGIERWLLSILGKTDRGQVAMDFCCKGSEVGSWANVARDMGAKVYHCPLRPSHWGYLQELSRILQTGKYDVVHNHLQNYAGIGTYVARRCKVPVIAGFHNTAFPSQNLPNLSLLQKVRELYGYFSIKYAVTHSNLITGCSQAVVETVCNKYGAPPESCRVIYYGVEVPEPATSEAKLAFRQELGLGRDSLIITHIGRFLPQKNHHGLVRVAAQVISQDPRAHFVLVGDGPLRPEIEKMVQEKNLAGHFSFLGIRQDVERILACSDIFFLPSFWEGLPVVILEAMAASLPIVASVVDGIKEEVLESKSGYLCNPIEENNFVDRILDLMSDSAKRRIFGEYGYNLITTKFSLKTTAKNICGLYESVSHP